MRYRSAAVCPLRRRAGGDGRVRRDPAQAARCARARGIGGAGVNSARRSGATQSTPITPARPSIAAGMSRMCCYPVITSGSARGDASAARTRPSAVAAMPNGKPVLSRPHREWVRRRGPGVRYHCSPRRPDTLIGVTSSVIQGAHLLYLMSSVIETIEPRATAPRSRTFPRQATA